MTTNKLSNKQQFQQIEDKLSSSNWLSIHPTIIHRKNDFENLRIILQEILKNYKVKYFDSISELHWYWKIDLFNYFKFSIENKIKKDIKDNKDSKEIFYWSDWLRNIIVNWLIFDNVIENRKKLNTYFLRSNFSSKS